MANKLSSLKNVLTDAIEALSNKPDGTKKQAALDAADKLYEAGQKPALSDGKKVGLHLVRRTVSIMANVFALILIPFMPAIRLVGWIVLGVLSTDSANEVVDLVSLIRRGRAGWTALSTISVVLNVLATILVLVALLVALNPVVLAIAYGIVWVVVLVDTAIEVVALIRDFRNL